jgi:hypothetical protein
MKRCGSVALVFLVLVFGSSLIISCGGGSSGDGFVITATTILENNANGYLMTAVRYDDKGLDDKWHTPDDVIDNYSTVIRNPDDTRVRWELYGGYGDNGTWFNSDDVMDEYCLYQYYVGGGMLRGDVYGDPGVDGIFLSGDDDVMTEYFVYTYYVAGSLNGKVSRQLVRNSDNSIKWYYSYIYDGNGRMIKGEVYDHPGSNGTWFNSDDVMAAYYTYGFDSDGWRKKMFWYYEPGNDGVWMNGDDPVHHYYKFKRDENMYIVREDRYEPYTPPDNGGVIMSLAVGHPYDRFSIRQSDQ